MANTEHLAILKQGVEAWNRWRDEHPDIRPDLTQAYLRDASLVGVNMQGAVLRSVVLRLAELGGADLSDTDLNDADLCTANLEGATLRGADLGGANLCGANLRQADLEGSLLWDTAFGNVDLTGAKGLSACDHWGRSILDDSSLTRSGPLPIEFLRGCGLSDEFIELAPVLRGNILQFYSCFISYSHNDEDFAKRLRADLQDNGVRCWFAPEDLRIGERTRRVIFDEIRVRDKLLLIFSRNSVESEWVGDEVEAALEEEKRRGQDVLFPVRIDDSVMKTDSDWAAKIRRTRHIGDFCNRETHTDYQKAFDRLLRDLKQIRAEEASAF